jgi:Sec-independent protein translocase protein TatA
MENTVLYNEWLIGLAIVSAIVVIAAVLLIIVWLAAKRILRLARIALEVVKEIQKNTNSIWELEKTNAVAGSIQDEAKAIEIHASLVAEALEEIV